MNKNEVKKKRRVPAQIISFDDEDDDNRSCLSYTSGSSISQDKTIPISFVEDISKADENINNSVLTSKPKNDYIAECFPKIYTSSAVDKDNTQAQTTSEDTFTSKSSAQKIDVFLTPVQHSDIGELIPVVTEQYNSESPESLDETIEIPSDIVAVLTTVENKNKEEQDLLLDKISILTKENENLRLQLKKYVTAVQMLKFDSSSAHVVLDNLNLSQENKNDELNCLIEIKVYESKLVQVC